MEILNVTTDTFVPAAISATGTITTHGTNFLTSTASQVRVGDYVADATQKESRRVMWINRDGTTGQLNNAFTSDLSTLSLAVIGKEDCKIIGLSISADQSTDIEIDGKTIKDGTSINDFIAEKQASLGYGFVKPVYGEGSTTGAFTALITRFGNQR